MQAKSSRIIRLVATLFISALLFIGLYLSANRYFFGGLAQTGYIEMRVKGVFPQNEPIQVFFSTGAENGYPFCQENSYRFFPSNGDTLFEARFFLPGDSVFTRFRIDPGIKPAQEIRIFSLSFSNGSKELHWTSEDIKQSLRELHDMKMVKKKEDTLVMRTTGGDPFFVLNKSIPEDFISRQSKHVSPLATGVLIIISLLISLLLLRFSERWIKSLIYLTLSFGLFLLMLYLSQKIEYRKLLFGQNYSQTRLEVMAVIPAYEKLQLFYADTVSRKYPFTAENSTSVTVSGSPDLQKIVFPLPNRPLRMFRLDPGSFPFGYREIESIRLVRFDSEFIWTAEDIDKDFPVRNSLSKFEKKNNRISFNIKGTDPFIAMKNDISLVYNSLMAYNPYQIIGYIMSFCIALLFYFYLEYFKRE